MIFTPAVVVAGLKIPSSLGVNSVELGSNVERGHIETKQATATKDNCPNPSRRRRVVGSTVHCIALTVNCIALFQCCHNIIVFRV